MDGREDGIVSPQRMADAADAVGIHPRQRNEQVNGPDVVVESLHRAALVAEFGIEVVFVITE